MALPALLWIIVAREEPRRTRWVVAAYCLAPSWLLAHLLKVDLLAAPLLAGAAELTKSEAGRNERSGSAVL
jgi:hypothetical protein